jgi:hypothetical protein
LYVSVNNAFSGLHYTPSPSQIYVIYIWSLVSQLVLSYWQPQYNWNIVERGIKYHKPTKHTCFDASNNVNIDLISGTKNKGTSQWSKMMTFYQRKEQEYKWTSGMLELGHCWALVAARMFQKGNRLFCNDKMTKGNIQYTFCNKINNIYCNVSVNNATHKWYHNQLMFTRGWQTNKLSPTPKCWQTKMLPSCKPMKMQDFHVNLHKI